MQKILTTASGLALGDKWCGLSVSALLKSNTLATIGWSSHGEELFRETVPNDFPYLVERNLIKPELREVFVTVAIPKNGNKQFVYGVFTSEDKALDYIENNAPKDCIYATSKELVIQ